LLVFHIFRVVKPGVIVKSSLPVLPITILVMIARFYSAGKFTILLAAVLLLSGLRLAASGDGSEELLLDVFAVIVVFAGVLALCVDGRHRLAALILGSPAILLTLVSHAFPGEVAATVHLLGRISVTIFSVFIVASLIRAVITARAVSWETISAALVGYVMLAIGWTQVYRVLELKQPGSFAVANSAVDQLDDVAQRQAILEYFSFATISTLGYGDISPVSRPARSLACLEAICGQLYLAVLVAGLVGMRGTRTEPTA
jgi:hypothetical protein